MNCFGIKKVNVNEIVLMHAVTLSKRLAKTSCNSVNCYHILNVFSSYRLGIHYFNPYLTIDRKE